MVRSSNGTRAPAQHVEALFVRDDRDLGPGLGGVVAVVGQERQSGRVPPGAGKVEPVVCGDVGQEPVGHLQEDPRPVPGVDLGPGGPAVGQPLEDLQTVRNERVAAASPQVGDQPDAAGVVLECRVVESTGGVVAARLRSGHGRPSGLVSPALSAGTKGSSVDGDPAARDDAGPAAAVSQDTPVSPGRGARPPVPGEPDRRIPGVGALDAVVIGGGVIGLSSAWRAAGRGLDVAVVDPAVGRGASWVAAGMLAPVTEAHFGEEPLVRLLVAAAGRWKPFAEELEAVSAVEIGYRPCGTVVVAMDASDRAAVDEVLAFQQALGLDAERLSPSECRHLVPALAPGVRGGASVPGDHQVDNRRLLHALTVACGRAGVHVIAESARAVETDGVRPGDRGAAGRRLCARRTGRGAGRGSACFADRRGPTPGCCPRFDP